MTAREFKANAIKAAQSLPNEPSWKVMRNGVGNFSFLDADGRYVGYVDFRAGEVSVFPKGWNESEGDPPT